MAVHRSGPGRSVAVMHRRRVLASFATLGLAASLLGSAPASGRLASLAQAACPSPAPPLAHASIYPGNEELPVIGGTQVAEQFSGPISPQPLPTVVLERAGTDITITGSAGDLDGDANDEFVVMVLTSSDPTVDPQSYLIPGDATGTHDPADIGIRLAFGAALLVDSRDGDATPDLALTDRYGVAGGRTVIYSTAALAGLTAPADGRSTGVLLDAPGALVATADLGAPVKDLVLAETFDSPAHVVLHVGGEDGFADFTTEPYGSFNTIVGGDVTVPEIHVNDTGTYLQVVQGDRDGVVGFVWRIDDPCGALPPQPVQTTTSTTQPSTTPPPATPVRGDASFTG